MVCWIQCFVRSWNTYLFQLGKQSFRLYLLRCCCTTGQHRPLVNGIACKTVAIIRLARCNVLTHKIDDLYMCVRKPTNLFMCLCVNCLQAGLRHRPKSAQPIDNRDGCYAGCRHRRPLVNVQEAKCDAGVHAGAKSFQSDAEVSSQDLCSFCDDRCSWVKAPPNRTIGHHVDSAAIGGRWRNIVLASESAPLCANLSTPSSPSVRRDCRRCTDLQFFHHPT